jgi:hypothetical protein
MNRLLKITALLEVPAGLGLIAAPVLVVRLLLGAEISGAALPLARVAGVALLALGIACWLASYDAQGCGARGVICGMAIYNLGTVLVLGIAGIASQSAGVLLWPAVILHAAMAVWCITTLRRGNPSVRS